MKRFFVGALSVIILIMLAGCGNQSLQVQHTDTAMGTIVQQNIYTEENDDSITSDIISLLKNLEEQELSWRLETSEIYRVNESAGSEEGYLLSKEMAEILEKCIEAGERSQGAFDITMGSVVRLWNLDSWASGIQTGKYELPLQEELSEALAASGADKLSLMKEYSQARLYLPEGMQLDLGAVGKGLALDRIVEYLEGQEKITGATISVGGSVLTYGEKPDGGSWKVGIVNPKEPSEYVGILELQGQWCVSTSGDYERYMESDGIRYHHIIDPETGYPADSSVSGVTVLAKNGFVSDILSTACFILGEEEGVKLAESYGAEVLFVGKSGEIIMTEGMKAVFTTVR